MFAARSGWCVVHARVDHRHDDRRASGRRRPGLGSVDVGVRRSGGRLHRLPGVVQPPELAEERVVRKCVDAVDGVRLGEAHARVAAKLREGAAAGRRQAPRRRRRGCGAGGRWLSHPRARGRRAARPGSHRDRSRRGFGLGARGAAARRLRARRRRTAAASASRIAAGPNRSRSHVSSLGAGAGRYKAPTGGLSVVGLRAS